MRVLAGLLLLESARVAAQPAPPPSEERCLQAYEQGQRLRLKHALLDARAELLLCAQTACPATFRPDCVQWYDEVQHLVPSVIIAGSPSSDVRVLVDGKLVASRLDGTPIEVDPGEHVFRFEPANAAPSEQTVLIIEGQRDRVMTISTLPAPPPQQLPPPTTPVPESPRATVAPWVFGGVSVVALGSFAYFGATGLSIRDRLDACGRNCRQADIDRAHLHFDIADVSLAISAVSLGIAIYEWVSHPRQTGVHLDAGAGPGNAFIGVGGAF